MAKLDDLARFHAKSRAAWRRWLAAHHLTSPGVWLVTYKKATGKPRIDYAEAVEELLCVGWIDSVPRALDDERAMLLCTPRKASSAWSKANKERAARLMADGLTMPRGLEVVAAAKASRSWDTLTSVDAMEMPSDLLAAMAARPKAREHFDGFPPGVRRQILAWILSAKRPDTRTARVHETARLAAKGERANQWRPKEKR